MKVNKKLQGIMKQKLEEAIQLILDEKSWVDDTVWIPIKIRDLPNSEKVKLLTKQIRLL